MVKGVKLSAPGTSITCVPEALDLLVLEAWASLEVLPTVVELVGFTDCCASILWCLGSFWVSDRVELGQGVFGFTRYVSFRV